MENNKKTIVLTGSSGGIGSAVHKLLTSKGYRVLGLDICESNDKDFFQTDISNAESVNEATQKIKASYGEIDAIIHTAGIYKMNSLVEITEEELLKIFNVNFFGIYRVNKAFLPLLKQNSKIIMISSELAPLDPLPFTGLYAITKATIEKYAYSLRMETQLLGHRVTVIRPGSVNTKLLGESQKAIEKFCSETELYQKTSKRFLTLVNKIETANISADKVAKIISKALKAKKPHYVYNINRSFLLRLFSALPQHLQNALIKKILL